MILFFIMLLEPIIAPGPPGSWDDMWVLDGHVIIVEDTLKMWYLGKTEDTVVYNRLGIGYAYSSDTGKSWQKYPGNPVFVSDSNSKWEHTSTGHNDGLWEAVVIYEEGEYKMWYHCWDESNCRNTLYARSDDGINWERRNQGKPVVYTGYYEGGMPQWDSDYAGARAVIKRNGMFYLFYEGESFGMTGSFSMGLAIGTNETTFVKVDTTKPIFTTIGTPDTVWAGVSIIPNVILDDETFILLYSSNSSHTGLTTVGLAVSKDGVNWERYSRNPICNLKKMGFPCGALTSVYWDFLSPGLTKELVAILRSIPNGIYSCKMSFLLVKP